MAPNAYKNRRECNVFQITCQITLVELLWQSVGLDTCPRMKIARPIILESFFRVNPEPSTKAQCITKLNPFNLSIHPKLVNKHLKIIPFSHTYKKSFMGENKQKITFSFISPLQYIHKNILLKLRFDFL